MIDREWQERADDGDGSFAIACALIAVARAIQRLGNADAATPMGAIEAFGLHIGEKFDSLIGAIEGIKSE